ncbi:restriction endonuclease subunit S [Escherichia coli]|uniref:restriction endonuclease subunit S n=1 Tax=Escherichia coli TaxID=562 RepID=UPI002282221F|nr:restriction endonuclease subunit S [Escherichia coli]MCZ0184853.1 restriction endonuclease subunit S [Escherichia coli]MCZ0305563.1 restriction endonuclease subunit S [Escherichia coli]MCZ0306390.1 restriction endonuclease subunit S [Escherichia coli]MCZ0334998.1 restriction endonuclease subunit S [Escherichia coli]MCZ0404902.1 restriction endonuclease subunit S [Escherichia coli]
MSELSYLEKLLDGVEVEWKTLGTVIKTVTASSKLKSQAYRASGKLPIVDQGIKFIAGYTDEDVTPIEAGKYIIFGDHSEHIKYVDFPFVQGADGLKILSPISANAKYIYHAFLKFYKKELSYKRHWSTAQQTLIPIPCPDNPEKSLAIQSEIVRILDKFTALTAELTAELNMRKKQYNYYRDQLLSFKEGEVEWKTLGEIGDFTYGYAAKAMDSGDARFVRITDINKDGKLSKENPMYVELNEENEKYTLDKNDLLMARTGATFGKTMIFEEDYPAVYAGFLIKLNLNKTIINAKYYWHFAQSDFFWEQANKLVSGGGQPQFNANALKQVRVPIPYPSHPQKSLDEQGRIVDILDKFDAIAASITEGLPREIELRQKQYEYYRDLLLSFPKPETVSK